MIDLYCERVGPGLWAEPLNASTNVAFFIAAWAIAESARRARALTVPIWLLVGLVCAIGTGSGLFHTFATPWARALDVVPILMFQLTYLWFYLRRIAAMRFAFSAAILTAFLLAAFVGRQFPDIMNGSLIYAPAFFLILSLGLYHFAARKRKRLDLLAAAGIFAIAVFFRTIDNDICSCLPLGTHFLWHLLNPAVLYLSARSLISNMSSASPTI